MDEKISNKIAKITDFGTFIQYRATCGCGSSDCGLTLELEYDPEINYVTLNIYQDLLYCSWFGVTPLDKFYWFKDMWNRIKGALRLLLTGRIRLEESFLFKEEGQINDFIAAIQEGREKIKDAVEKEKESNQNKKNDH